MPRAGADRTHRHLKRCMRYYLCKYITIVIIGTEPSLLCANVVDTDRNTQSLDKLLNAN